MLQTLPRRSAQDQKGSRLARIVLIEDNPGDVELVRLACAEIGLQADIRAVADADAAIVLMREVEPPAVVVLDINLPIMRGDDMLRMIRGSSPWREVPVVVLTSSQREIDAERCLTWGATAYKIKPAAFDGFLEFARSLRRFTG